MNKEFVQNAIYSQRERNFIKVITAPYTLQVIIGRCEDGQFLLWQDEYYLQQYPTTDDLVLSKVDTFKFIEFVNKNIEARYSIHPVQSSQDNQEISGAELLEKLSQPMSDCNGIDESELFREADFYDE